MLRYLYASDLAQHPTLRDTMFRDRAGQFRTRLGWDVTVDAEGFERDEYDDLNPLYVIWEKQDGTHGGSMRFLPTIGRTLVHEHFAHLCGGVHIASPYIWEATRFCLATKAERRVAAALLVGAGELIEKFHLRHIIGVFDPRMIRIYKTYGIPPEIIGHSGDMNPDWVGVGLFQPEPNDVERGLKMIGIDPETSKSWIDRSFRQKPFKIDTDEPVAATVFGNFKDAPRNGDFPATP